MNWYLLAGVVCTLTAGVISPPMTIRNSVFVGLVAFGTSFLQTGLS